MGYRINENKTSIVPFQSGSGAPNHLSFLGTVYVDNLTGIQYINKDGLANWAYLLDSSMPISGGTSGGTVTGAYVPLSGGTMSGTLYAPTFSGGTFYGNGSNLTGVGSTFTGGTVSGNTIFINGLTATTISATTYLNLPSTSGLYLPLSGGTVTGPTIFTGGVSANTLSNVQWIDFSTAATVTQATGRVFYDTGEQSLAYYPDINQAVTVRVGQQLYVRVYNVSGAVIPKGSVVSVTGTSNNLPSITLSKNNHEITSARPIGLSADNIPNNNVGLVITNGILSGITLNNFNNGDTLYLSPFSAGTYVSNTATFPFTARTNEIGYVIQTGTTTGKIYVTINNEDSNLSLTDIERNILEGNVVSSGAYQYTGMTLGTGQTINISLLKGWIVKNTYDYATLPDVTNINYTGGTNIPLTYLSAASATYLLINSASTLTQQITFPTPQERRQNIFIGKVVHPNKTTITSLNQTVDFDVSPMAAIRDLWTPIKLINQGITVSPHSTTLEINTSAGTLWGNGIGWTTNQLNPDSVSLSATSPTTFQYRTQTGGTFSNTTTIDCTHYDVNGVVTVIPGNNGSQLSRATNQRVYLFPTGLIRIQYGQQWYDSLTLAIAGIQNEIFNEYINNRDNGILIGIITVARSTTNLSDSTQAYFSLTSKFGELFGGTAGISTTTLQQAYDNSTTPEIVINSTLDGLTIKNGTGNADNITHLLEGQNAAGNITSFITADGTFSGSTLITPSFRANANGLTATTVSATTYYNLPLDIRTTGATYSNNTFTYTNNTGGTYSVLFNTLTGLTINGGLSATTISGDTLYVNNNTLLGSTVDNGNKLQVTGNIYTSGNIGIGTASPTHSLTLNNTSTGIAHYNTADQTTNYQRFRKYWSGNYYYSTGESGGTGFTVGTIFGTRNGLNNITFNQTLTGGITTSYNALIYLTANGANWQPALYSGATYKPIFLVNGTLTATTTGSHQFFQIAPTILNASGGTAINILRITPNIQNIGTGTAYLIDAGTNNANDGLGTHTSVFTVDNIGNTTIGTTNPLYWNNTTKRLGIGVGATGNTATLGLDMTTYATDGYAFKVLQSSNVYPAAYLSNNGGAGDILQLVGIGSTTNYFTNAGTLGLGSRDTTKSLYLNRNLSVNNPSTNGVNLVTGSNTFTDTANVSTASTFAINVFNTPTINNSSFSGVTQYTNAYNVYIAGAVNTGSNAAITNPYALYVNSGATYFGGTVNGLTVGIGAGSVNTNTVLGNLAFTANTSAGTNCVAIGYQSLQKSNTLYNTAVGSLAMQNMTGGYNVAVGYATLVNSSNGRNTAVGAQAASNNTSGQWNTAIGNSSLQGNTSGSNNVAVGYNAGISNTIINNSVILGSNASALANSDTNEIVIGYSAGGNGSNTTVIGNTGTTSTQLFGNLLLSTTQQQSNNGYKLQVYGTTYVSGSELNSGAYGSVIVNAGNNQSMLTISGSNTVGGVGYVDFLKVTNTFTGATTPSKTFRLNSTGGLEIIDNAYTANTFTLTNSGNLTIGGSLTIPNRPAFRVSGSSVTGIAATTTITGTQGAVIDYNQGGYYNSTTGIFTAPIAGLYQVYLNLRTQSAGTQQAIIVKNTSTNMIMWETNSNTGHFGVSGIIYLAVNDTLKVNVTVGTVQFDSNDSWGAAYIG